MVCDCSNGQGNKESGGDDCQHAYSGLHTVPESGPGANSISVEILEQFYSGEGWNHGRARRLAGARTVEPDHGWDLWKKVENGGQEGSPSRAAPLRGRDGIALILSTGAGRNESPEQNVTSPHGVSWAGHRPLRGCRLPRHTAPGWSGGDRAPRQARSRGTGRTGQGSGPHA